MFTSAFYIFLYPYCTYFPEICIRRISCPIGNCRGQLDSDVQNPQLRCLRGGALREMDLSGKNISRVLCRRPVCNFVWPLVREYFWFLLEHPPEREDIIKPLDNMRRVISFICYPATCSPKGHGNGGGLFFLHDYFPSPRPT